VSTDVCEGKFAEVHLLKSALHSDSFIIDDDLFKFAEAHILKSTLHSDSRKDRRART
jgi:hypothetical protein